MTNERAEFIRAARNRQRARDFRNFRQLHHEYRYWIFSFWLAMIPAALIFWVLYFWLNR